MNGADNTLTLANDGNTPQKPDMGKIGPYRIVEFLGRGGAGMVYRAADADNAEVALKVITATPLVPQSEIKRFLREAETSKLLRRHPNIITVYDTGQDGQNYYIAMELVPGGRTLRDMLGKNLSVKEVLDYAIPIARALEYAHKEGILHRDLKSANILINEFNQPLLADFGLAKTENSQHLTMTGTIQGTPRYMSPEQCGMGDGKVTNQSDIYSFGFMIYELLTGLPPYPIPEEMQLPEIFRQVCTHEAKPPRRLRRDVSRNLEAVILRMLEKEKKLRYKDMSQVRADLEACQAGTPVSVRRLTLAERWEKWLRRHSAQAITVATALAVGGMLYYFFVLPRTRESGFAKQRADVSAFAAKRKATLLKGEIEVLKHQGAPVTDDETTGNSILIKARSFLAEGRFDEAENQYQSAIKWAQNNGHNGILYESENSLARIALAKGNNSRASKMFQNVAFAYGDNTLNGRIALFESGAAEWLQKNKAAASQIWQKLADMDRRGGKKADVDIRDSCSYVKVLSKLMLNCGKNAGIEKIIPLSPKFLRGLGYWVLAQNSADEEEKKEFLAEAVKNKGLFIWIKQEEEKNDNNKQTKENDGQILHTH